MFGQTNKEEAELDRVLNLIDQPSNVNTARRLLGELSVGESRERSILLIFTINENQNH